MKCIFILYVCKFAIQNARKYGANSYRHFPLKAREFENSIKLLKIMKVLLFTDDMGKSNITLHLGTR